MSSSGMKQLLNLLCTAAKSTTGYASGAGAMGKSFQMVQGGTRSVLGEGPMSALRHSFHTHAANAAAQKGVSALPKGASFLKELSNKGGRSFSAIFLRLKSTAAVVGEAASSSGPAAATELIQGSAALSHGLSDSARRQLMWWMGGSAVWVYSMVVLGGVTRLTRSGLSMTEWKFTGEKSPSSQKDWEEEFDRYRSSPEFKKLHSSMTLEEFKFIFWMEYAHRMWGRLLGIGFVIPGAYFLARGFIKGAFAKRLGLLFFMGGTQGLVGWWMVRSGLTEPKNEWETPRVSPYRLAAHLVSAFAIYTTLVWTTLDLAYPKPVSAAVSSASQLAAKGLRRYLLPMSALVAVTATSGAFVAGMDAGRAYNTYPLMSGQIVPPEYWQMSGVANFFENTAAVQFNHRALATTTLVTVLTMWATVRSSAAPPMAKRCMDLVMAVTAVQFALGIYTLLEYVPVHLGSMHQANALNLFTAVLCTLHALRPPVQTAGSQLIGRVGIPMGVLAVSAIAVAVTQHK